MIARSGGPFWPPGASLWELSVSHRVRSASSTDDFRERTTQVPPEDRRQTTYVAVTGRRFPEKTEWASEKAATSGWAGVRVFDVDDLAARLTLAPAVSSWFASEHLGVPAKDISDIDTFLAAWSQRTAPPLPAQLALSRRSEVAATFREWLQGPPVPIRISADTREEAVVFAAACVALDTSPLGEAQKLRAVVVHTEAALRWIVAQANGFDGLILPTFAQTKVTTGLAKARIVVALDPEAVSAENSIKLGPVRREDIFRALVAGGIEEKRRLADSPLNHTGDSTRSSGSLATGYVEPPPWARNEAIRDLVVLLLLGAYVHGVSADRDAFETLGCPPAQIEQVCNRLLHAEGAPWFERAAPWFGHRIRTHGMFLHASSQARCSSPSSPPPRRFLVGTIRGSSSPGTSGFLPPFTARPRHTPRRCARDSQSRSPDSPTWRKSGPYANAVSRVVGAILTSDWRRWATLSKLLVPLAEAAPTVFLDRLDESLAADEDGVAHLFKEETSFRNVHTGLLWALDRIAWSDAHLTRVVLVLARLAERDPGGTWANRPARKPPRDPARAPTAKASRAASRGSH